MERLKEPGISAATTHSHSASGTNIVCTNPWPAMDVDAMVTKGLLTAGCTTCVLHTQAMACSLTHRWPLHWTARRNLIFAVNVKNAFSQARPPAARRALEWSPFRNQLHLGFAPHSCTRSRNQEHWQSCRTSTKHLDFPRSVLLTLASARHSAPVHRKRQHGAVSFPDAAPDVSDDADAAPSPAALRGAQGRGLLLTAALHGAHAHLGRVRVRDTSAGYLVSSGRCMAFRVLPSTALHGQAAHPMHAVSVHAGVPTRCPCISGHTA